jgi:hypothetical protein
MTYVSVRYAIGFGIIVTALMQNLAFAQSGPAPAIPQASWTLHFVDSQEANVGGYAATNAFDGDPATMWATEWLLGEPPPPHDLQINLGGVFDVSGFRYLPRQDGQSEGRIGQYQFYVSMDGANWGTAVASQMLANVGTEQQVLFSTKRGQYIRLRAMTEVAGDPWTTVAELNVLGTSVGPSESSEWPIPQGSWTVHFVDSQETLGGDYRAVNAFDGDPGSMWVTEWWSTTSPVPHQLQINLGAVYDVRGFRYLPRQDGQPHGRIGQYQFYVSMDGAAWGPAVASGTFPNSGDQQQQLFATKRGQFVRLVATTEVNGRPWTAVAELSVLATGDPPPTGGNQPPTVSLSAVGQGPYVAPASIALRASAGDPDGTVTRVDFYVGSTLVSSEALAPYDALIPNLGAGTYTFRAVAVDNRGSTGTSNTVSVAVGSSPQQPSRAVFTPSADHDTLVNSYVLKIYTGGSNPSTGVPVATLDLGKPGIVNGECEADITLLLAGLNPGTYFGTLTAVGSGGSATSSPSPPFNR